MATTTTTGGNKLAQEINDEFLTCKICLEAFKNPKCLDCLHTFCEPCIDNHVMSECTYKKYSDYREFTCPLCRKRTQLPLGGVKKLPDNFLVSSLSELVARQRPSKFPFCDICKLVSKKHREATSKCLDCNKLLCKQCVELHKDTKVTKNHSIFDVEIEKDIECKEHQEEVVRFYCEPCEACICVLCTFNEHKDHEITSFNDAVIKYKETISNLLESCKSKIDSYDSQLTLLSKCESNIQAAEQRIRDTAIQFIADIRTKEKQFIDELHQIYGKDLMDYVTRRGDMQVSIDGLKSTCNLTELVLKGKDIELLLLKKQVQEKLSSLADIDMKDLPDAVHKHITFVPGRFDMGCLEDMDKPSPKFKQTRSFSSFYEPRDFEQPKLTKTSETQTDEMENEKAAETSTAYIQTEPHPRFSQGMMEDKGTEMEHKETVEKAVNTRSRSLIVTHQLKPGEELNNENERSASPSGRRHRRRRERSKNEVSPKPPNNAYQATLTMTSRAAPVLTYSSSIDENYYSPEGGIHSPPI